MKFKGTLVAPSIDMTKYLDVLHKQLTAAIQTACREWLNVTANTIPVWSGASVATFQKLAAEVSHPLSIVPVSRKDRIDMGFAASSGSITADVGTGEYSFSYATSLAHLITNEYTDANSSNDPTVFARLLHPGPYHFQERGQAAFTAYAAKVKLPNPFAYIKKTTVRVG